MAIQHPPKFDIAPRQGPQAPERPHDALQSFEEEIRTVGINQMVAKIQQDPTLNPVEKVGKTLGVCSIALKAGVEDLEKAIKKVKSFFGLEDEEIEPYLPGPLDPDPEHYSDAEEGNISTEKIKSSQEKDILKFLREKNWMEYARKASSKFGVPLFVLLAIIRRESGFKSDAYTYKVPDIDKRTGKQKKDPATGQPLFKYASSARGLGQFLTRDWENFQSASRDENPWGASADRLNPEHAFWATARHIRNKVRDVNQWVSQSLFPSHFRLNLGDASPGDVKWIYTAYMNGAWGYCVLRRYLENPTPDNFEKLTWFQKRGPIVVDGVTKKRSHIEAAQKASNGGVATAKSFYHQIMEKNPALARLHLRPGEAPLVRTV